MYPVNAPTIFVQAISNHSAAITRAGPFGKKEKALIKE